MDEPLDSCDVLVIGAGIHGVGVAQAAAADGYRVMVLEQSDVAAATSSRSSKLIHGGLRYLEQGRLRLVWEGLREREVLLRIAPTLVKRQRFFIPIYAHTTRRHWQIRSGLTLYALLAGLRPHTWFRSLPRDEWQMLDGLQTAGLQAVYQYWDAQTDDRLLTRAVMRSARMLGAALCCPAAFLRAAIHADGCHVRFRYQHRDVSCRAAVVVNAAGPWANHVLARCDPPLSSVPVELIRGTHLEVPGQVTQGCYYIEARADRRAVFVMPWQGHALLGTTETAYDGDPGRVQPLEEERRYLLGVYREYFPGRSDEVLDAWAGLRVLPVGTQSPFRRSRETFLPLDTPRRPRVVSIFGGKLTSYRATARRVMHCLKPSLPPRQRKARTSELILLGP
jgi:glycerol-3-phosphate dehydrogenase